MSKPLGIVSRLAFWSDRLRMLSRGFGGKSRSSQNGRRHASSRFLRIEPLEARSLLSAVPNLPANWVAHPPDELVGAVNPDDTFSSTDLTPAQVRAAYGLSTGSSSNSTTTYGISFHGVQGDGSGQTIAIVDAYDDPDALTDLTNFSSAYGLPQFNGTNEPTFQKLDENGGTEYPIPDPAGELPNNDWEFEESLDIEWAHAMAPMANIDLFEANSAGNDLYTAVATAAKTPGVVAISMSWSGAEFTGEQSYDSTYFVTPSGHLGGAASLGGSDLAGGVTFLAATGDYGAYTSGTSAITPQYPASSPNVVAVGGTALTVGQSTSTGNYYYDGETSWGNGSSSGTKGGGGGGISGASGISSPESQPTYQVGVVNSKYSLDGTKFTTPSRVYPDVSAAAYGSSGSVIVYDSYSSDGYDTWGANGTSLATPLWAGMVAVADQGRAIAGLGSLNGASQTLPDLYSMAAGSSYGTYFNDVDTGSANGPTNKTPSYAPNAGYDTAYNLATGLGSPKGAALIPALAGPSVLAFSQQPTSAIAGASISPSITVDVENASGTIVTSDNSYVTLTIGGNPLGTANLLGTRTVQAVNGVATFSGLSIGGVTNGYTLVASDGGLSSATSASFNITANAAEPNNVNYASATPSTVTGKTAALSVLGSDPNSQPLTYTWSTIAAPSGAAAPTFSVNGSTSAANTTATFSAAGTYTLLAIFTDTSGYTKGSTLTLTVSQTLTSLSISPSTTILSTDSQEQFSVTGIDQFGNSMGAEAGATWSATNGTLSSSGQYTAPASGGSDTVTAHVGGLTANGSVTIVAPSGWWKLNDGSGTSAADSSGSPDSGTITNGTWITPPTSTYESSAVQFNGSSSVVTLTSASPSKLMFASNDVVTFSAWVKPTSTSSSGSEYVIDDGTSATNDMFLMLSYGYYEVGIDNGTFHGVIAPIPASDANTWVQLVGTYDGTTWKIYRDGQLLNSWADASDSVNPSGGMWAVGGAAWSGSGRNFSGDICDARVYNTAISSTVVAGLAGDPPTVTAASAATPSAVTGTTTALSVTAAANAGASALTYTWATAGTPPAPVTFSANGTSASNNTTATFTKSGTYNFTVTITNAAGFIATSSVSVTVSQTLSSIAVTPSLTSIASDATQQFVATAYDQFGNAMSSPPTFTWSLVSGTGSISSSGVYTAPYASGSATVKATSGGFTSNVASLTVTDSGPTVATAASETPLTPTTASVSVLGAESDDGGETNLTYAWSSTGPANVTFSASGTNAAQNTTATFSQAGSYTLIATITDLGGLTTTSSVNVTVGQTLTSIAVTPTSASLASAATEQFSATAYDQFGSAMSSQPTFTWSLASGGGSIESSGLYTAPYASGSASVQATSGAIASNSPTITVTDTAPTVATPAAATPGAVTGTTTSLSVLGADGDGGGEPNLSYAWSATGPANVTFSANGTNAAKNATATFSEAGSYTLTTTITDLGGLSTTSSVNVTVGQTVSAITVQSGSLNPDGTMTMTATGYDQFGDVLASQPAFTWSMTGDGSLSSSGAYTPPDTSGSATITASSGSIQGSDTVMTVLAGAQTISSDVNFASNVSVVVASGSTLTVSGTVNGGGYALNVSGPGTVLLSGPGSGIDGATVTSGTLVVIGASTLDDGSSLTVGDPSEFAPDGNGSPAALAPVSVAASPVATPVAASSGSGTVAAAIPAAASASPVAVAIVPAAAVAPVAALPATTSTTVSTTPAASAAPPVSVVAPTSDLGPAATSANRPVADATSPAASVHVFAPQFGRKPAPQAAVVAGVLNTGHVPTSVPTIADRALAAGLVAQQESLQSKFGKTAAMRALEAVFADYVQ